MTNDQPESRDLTVDDPFLPFRTEPAPPRAAENVLRHLPPVDAVLKHPGVRPLIDERGRDVVLGWVRTELDRLRSEVQAAVLPAERAALLDVVSDRVAARAEHAERIHIGRVINATGVILHTGLGRAPLSQQAKNALPEAAGATNVELDLETAARRYRGHQLEPAWRTLAGAEDSLIVNNNAAATLLTLQALCAGREVIISRGQLIEIGGSFRLPEIFELSGAVLREVGTTNRTRVADYVRAIGPETAAVMHVHTSNYRVVGFSETPGIADLVAVAREHGLLAIDDIGSGALVDVSKYGLPAEPMFSESLRHGADVVLGSGDKLLGGPQCGIILGRAEHVGRLRNHPLARAVRVGKLTLGALSATLDSYLRGAAEEEIPTLALLATPVTALRERAQRIRDEVANPDQTSTADSRPDESATSHDESPMPDNGQTKSAALEIEVRDDVAPVGGGSLPGVDLPTAVLALRHASLSAGELAAKLRLGAIRVVGRVQKDAVILDLRSVAPEDDSRIALALRLAAESADGRVH